MTVSGRWRRVLPILACALVAAACGDGAETSRTAAPAPAADPVTPPADPPDGDAAAGGVAVGDGAVDAAGFPLAEDDRMPLGALPDLPTCVTAALDAVDVPPTVVLPPGTIPTTVTTDAEVTTVEAYAPYTPSQVRRAMSASGHEVLTLEDEVLDAEVLVTDGSHRTYVKAVAACAQGSRLVAVTSPDLAANAASLP